ncbi:hypothetical protein [Novosphingobium sp. FKTRR1]|uniref:hypothetical protein n=1 Tax=unclassified Novosphingobium TaxID=2644732 RepID=UPI001CEFDDE3|nr:hypothetical protein [Novosphingobium sp. FKTRR1]
MALPQFRLPPAADLDEHAAPRLAGQHDAYVESPVHGLQAGLAVFEAVAAAPNEHRYPGWFRLGFPLVASSALWALIFAAVRMVI